MNAPMIQQHFTFDFETGETILTDKYIHSDLVNQLKGYTVHDPACAVNGTQGYCTCGLIKLLSKIGDP